MVVPVPGAAISVVLRSGTPQELPKTYPPCEPSGSLSNTFM